MINKIILILSCLFPLILFGQGSGSLLHLDNNDYVNINGAQANNFVLPPNFTLEAWITPTSTAGGQQLIIHFGSCCDDEYGVTFGIDNDDLFFHIWNDNVPIYDILTSTANVLSTTQPNHAAMTKSGNNVVLYYNGTSIASATHFSNYSTTQTLSSNIGHEYQNNKDRGRQYNGEIDEVRVWNFAKTQAQIRDMMCISEDGTSTGLLGCWNFNEGSGTEAKDISPGTNNATLTNFALTGTNSNWLLSDTPLGTISSYNYPAAANWNGQTVNLTSTNRGNIEVNTVTGTPDGIHIYRVDAVPNSTTGITPSLGSSNLYYGTFIVDGSSPTYSIEYDYSNYADAIAEESDLLLYNREDNSDPTWANLSATVNEGSNIITETVISRRGEFIVAGSDQPLPIELLYFDETLVNNEKVRLDWQTASEINNDYFTIERSANGTSWEEQASVSGAGNSSILSSYSHTDHKPYNGTSYYRLKQTDFDGKFEYSQIISVSIESLENSKIEMYPNPFNDVLTIEGNAVDVKEIIVYNTLGQNVSMSTQKTVKSETKLEIDLSKLGSGIYYIKTRTTTNKVYKQ